MTALPALAAAVALAAADLRIQSVTVGAGPRGAVTIQVVIVADGGDAHAVRLTVRPPNGLSPGRIPAGCHHSPAPSAEPPAPVVCDLGDLPVRGLRTVDLLFTAATKPAGKIGVLVESDSPDPLPSNNYVERSLP